MKKWERDQEFVIDSIEVTPEEREMLFSKEGGKEYAPELNPASHLTCMLDSTTKALIFFALTFGALFYLLNY